MTLEQPHDGGGKRTRSQPQKQRELELVRDIAEAYFNAQTPIEVYRSALARVTSLVRASFSSVFLRDEQDPELLRLMCAVNWPQTSARYLGQMRIRMGRGPTGRAVAERRAIEVEDLFADPAIRDWWEPARELGFASLISLPLYAGDRAVGAVTFYYSEPHTFSGDEQRLLALIAAQLSIAVERAREIETARNENARLSARIAELEVIANEAKDVQRLKNEFLANISHELRTPLTSILGYTYLLREQDTGNLLPDQIGALSKIDHSASVLLGLINDLLELTQYKLGRMQPSYTQAEAGALARRAAESAANPAEHVEFRVEPPSEPIILRTDTEKVMQILENLISNACKFTRNGEVVVTVTRRGGRVEWMVRDTGIGIQPGEQAAIFDEFRQVDGSSTRLYGGTGLGLALSLTIANLLGGEILVDSRVGEGSTFTLRLPADPREREVERDRAESVPVA